MTTSSIWFTRKSHQKSHLAAVGGLPRFAGYTSFTVPTSTLRIKGRLVSALIPCTPNWVESRRAHHRSGRIESAEKLKLLPSGVKEERRREGERGREAVYLRRDWRISSSLLVEIDLNFHQLTTFHNLIPKPHTHNHYTASLHHHVPSRR